MAITKIEEEKLTVESMILWFEFQTFKWNQTSSYENWNAFSLYKRNRSTLWGCDRCLLTTTKGEKS